MYSHICVSDDFDTILNSFCLLFVLNPLKICQNVHFFMPTTLIPGGSLLDPPCMAL